MEGSNACCETQQSITNAHDHGTEMIKIVVGRSESLPPTFSMHKNLLAKASRFFSGALKGKFKEANADLVLPEDCAMAFEVLYQWLYSGHVVEAQFYTRQLIPADLHWLRVYKMADAKLVERLQYIAFDRLKDILNDKKRYIPSSPFVAELFERGRAQSGLKRYVVAHTAYWIRNDNQRDYVEWKTVLMQEAEYGVRVAVQLAKVHSCQGLTENNRPYHWWSFERCVAEEFENDDSDGAGDHLSLAL